MKRALFTMLLALALGIAPAMALAQSDTSDDFRAIAEDILDQPAYSDEQPGLIARLRQWIDDQIDTPTREATEADAVDPLDAQRFQLGRSAVLIVVVIILLIWGTSFLIKYRSNIAGKRAVLEDTTEITSASELDRLAEQARAAGDWAAAIRYRFRAGVARLERKGALHYSPSLTSGEIARNLHDDEFDRLAETFDAITYGEAVAGEPDEDQARTAWPQVIDRAGKDAS